MQADPYPFVFDFVYRDYVWGGTRIPAKYARPPCPGLCAESWEISARPEGMSLVAEGPLRGVGLAEAARRFGRRLLGSACPSPEFPLLFKLIDARERLSLQVHPDEATARTAGGEPKTEAWYALDADPGAAVLAGFARPTSREEFAEALRANRVEPLLRSVPVRAGDVVFIPGRRVHAIGAGCLLLEIQQSSSTTYRVHDWGRVGADGVPRPLHTQQALDTIAWDDAAPPSVEPRGISRNGQTAEIELLRCGFFVVSRLDFDRTLAATNDGRSFHALFVESGSVELQDAAQTVRLGTGRSCLVPACVASYRLTPGGGPAVVIRTTLP